MLQETSEDLFVANDGPKIKYVSAIKGVWREKSWITKFSVTFVAERQSKTW